MGVVIVHPYQVPEGKSSLQTVEMLQKRVESLGGVKAGNFCIDCETYYTAQNISPKRTINILHNSEQPTSCYALIDTGTYLVADNLFDNLIAKLNGIYNPTKQTKIESKGYRYEVSDFLVKTGSVSIGSSFKGIIVEVEYQPCVIPASCWELMKEFMQGFLGGIVQTPPNYLHNKMNDIYTPVDTIFQYMEHFSNLRKVTAVAR